MSTSARERLDEIQRERQELHATAAARPRPQIESDIATVAQLAGIKAPAWSPYFRMTRDEVSRDEQLADEHDAIVLEYRRKKAARAQAKANARETAAVRAAACPVCYTTHAGEC